MLYQEHNVPLIDNDTTLHSPPMPDVIDANTSITKIDSTNKGHAMEGSQDSLRSDMDFEDCHPISADDIVSYGYIDKIGKKEASASVQIKSSRRNTDRCRCRFRDVAKVIQSEGRLASKVPRSCAQDIRLKEKEIALMLEQDMYTVSKFYAEQCRYVSSIHVSLHYLIYVITFPLAPEI